MMVPDLPTRLSFATLALAVGFGGVAMADAARSSPHDHDRGVHTGMGVDPFGHTRVLRRSEPSAADFVRARALTARLAAAIAPFATTERAVAAGYITTDERVPVGSLKHYVNERNFERGMHGFDPDAPMALLYRRTDAGFELAGAMYDAPIASTPAELDRRVPISLGQWHAHVKICQPKRGASVPPKLADGFGFSGWIANETECARAGGNFIPVVYGWMVHVYPFAGDPAAWF
jgi:hypothetical protein